MDLLRTAFVGAALLAGMGAPALAEQPAASRQSSFAGTFQKAIAYETLSSLMETGLFLAVFGGGIGVAAPVMALNFTTSLGVYLLNEHAWAHYAPQELATEESNLYGRAASFRALSLARIYATGVALGGGKAAPLVYTVSSNVADTALFIAFDNYFMARQAATQAAP